MWFIIICVGIVLLFIFVVIYSLVFSNKQEKKLAEINPGETLTTTRNKKRLVVQFKQYNAIATPLQVAKLNTVVREHSLYMIKVVDYDGFAVEKINCTLSALLLFCAKHYELTLDDFSQIASYLFSMTIKTEPEGTAAIVSH